jgi:protein-tyrosine kinase
MNLIEEAAKRMRQLEQAGVTINEPLPFPGGAKAPKPAAVRAPSTQNLRTIDFARLAAAGYITPGAKDSKLLHEMRIIKRPLIQAALGRGATTLPKGNLIMVTSALPGEGKTFVALNLAIAMAMEVDCRVLLVDADVLKPGLPEVLGIAPTKGLMDVLTDDNLDLGETLLRTDIERLSLLPAGRVNGEAHELLASDGMRRLLEELSSRYPDRIVVFDSPPLLATSESRVLANHVGQVLMVVEAERTTQATLEAALATVESCPVVLTMLNKTPESNTQGYYGYHAYGA